MLVAKYGKRTISPLTEVFANNQGVITDMSSLAEVVADMYLDEWTKSFEVLELDYDPINPNNNTRVLTQTDDTNKTETRDLTNSETSNRTINTATDTTITDNTTVSSTDQITNSGSDAVVTDNDRDQTITSTDSGSETEATNSTRESTDDRQINLSGNPDLGTTHHVSDDRTNTDTQNTSESMDSVAPYDSENMKNTNWGRSVNSNEIHSAGVLTETTVEKSNVVDTGSSQSTDSTTTTFGKVNTNHNLDKVDESTTTNYGKTTNGSASSTTAETHVDDIDTKTTDGLTSSSTEDGTITTVNNLKTNATETDLGNRWDRTKQEMVEQELELRTKNLSDRMIKDVANLLSLTVYKQEEF